LPAEICPSCQRPIPPEKTTDPDAPTRGKRWVRFTVVMPEEADKEALIDKLEILQARYEDAAQVRPARFVALDWALQELIDRNIYPGEEGA
jgi:hypothetical protein